MRRETERQLARVALEVRQTEVEDLDAPVGQAEHVLRLEVAMDDAQAMGGLESRRQRRARSPSASARGSGPRRTTSRSVSPSRYSLAM